MACIIIYRIRFADGMHIWQFLPLGQLLTITVLSGVQWAIVAGLSLMSIIQMEIWKGIRKYTENIRKTPVKK